MPRILYDGAVDALTVELTEGAKSAKTVAVTPGLRLDYDRKGRLVTIELLDASFHVDPEQLATIAEPSDLLTLAEAEAESGIRATTLRVQLNAGRLKGVKRGRDWYVEGAELMNYLESRNPSGRPPASLASARKQAARLDEQEVATRWRGSEDAINRRVGELHRSEDDRPVAVSHVCARGSERRCPGGRGCGGVGEREERGQAGGEWNRFECRRIPVFENDLDKLRVIGVQG